MAFNSLNQVVEVGRITAEPELKNTSIGVANVNFTLAVERAYAKKGEERETDFIQCVAWRGNAEFLAKFAHKGDVVGVQGELHSRKYEDKDGNKRTAYEVVADEISIFNGRKSDNTAPAPAPQQNTAPASIDIAADDDDLPF